MIGPGNSGGEGFARRLNRKDWLAENRDRPLSSTEQTAFATVLVVLLGMVGTLAAVQGIQAAEPGMGL